MNSELGLTRSVGHIIQLLCGEAKMGGWAKLGDNLDVMYMMYKTVVGGAVSVPKAAREISRSIVAKLDQDPSLEEMVRAKDRKAMVVLDPETLLGKELVRKAAKLGFDTNVFSKSLEMIGSMSERSLAQLWHYVGVAVDCSKSIQGRE